VVPFAGGIATLLAKFAVFAQWICSASLGHGLPFHFDHADRGGAVGGVPAIPGVSKRARLSQGVLAVTRGHGACDIRF
jgi:hypothetical protein